MAEPETPPTPMPGAKSSSAEANKPYVGEQTGDNSKVRLTPEEQKHAQTQVSVLQKLLGKQSVDPGTNAEPAAQPTTAQSAVDAAVSTAPGRTSDY